MWALFVQTIDTVSPVYCLAIPVNILDRIFESPTSLVEVDILAKVQAARIAQEYLALVK